jgi:hypothetical protein
MLDESAGPKRNVANYEFVFNGPAVAGLVIKKLLAAVADGCRRCGLNIP